MSYRYFNKKNKSYDNNISIANDSSDLLVADEKKDAIVEPVNLNVKNEETNIEEIKTNEQILEEVHKAAIVAEVQNNDETKEKIMAQAQKTIDQSIQELDNKNNLKVQQAMYDANKEACRCYGIEDTVPTWEVRMMKVGHGVWFVIYFIFATLTFCPINVFVKGIKSFIKNAWLAVLVGVICYLVIVLGIPLILSYLKK